MDSQLLVDKFRRMGARVKVATDAAVTRARIDIGHDRKGQFFDLRLAPTAGADAIDVRPGDRHLLLRVQDEDGRGLKVGRGDQRFLCGHDEREWFVAAVPEGTGASNVRLAMEALKPRPVRQAQEAAGVRFEDRFRRRNAAYVRQGEWFFVPAPRWVTVPQDQVLRDEPLSRTGGKPHRVEFLCRTGGELVYMHRKDGTVISRQQYDRRVRRNSALASEYTQQRRNMAVLVRGRVSHPDHKTIILRDWHVVYMNTEHQSQAMRFVAFID